MDSENIIQITSIVCKKEGRHGPYLIDRAMAKVVCKSCNKELNPMEVLDRLARSESAWRRKIQEFNEIKAKVTLMNRTKCEKCGQITRIQK